MKKVWVMWVMIFSVQFLQAQTFNEWFKQKKTQLKYLRNQIAALQVYIGFAQEGYQIVDRGLTTIGHIKDGDFNLHRDFFGALSNVPVAIRNSAQVADIIALQIKIVQVQTRNVARAKQSDQLSVKEVDYIVRVYWKLLGQSLDNMEELTDLLAGDKYVMTDDERMKRIDGLHRDMESKFGFARWFGDQTDLLVAGRRRDRNDVLVERELILGK